jgi:hypothetical protein
MKHRRNLKMRLVLRIIGTWFIGMAVILIIIDGTKSLAQSHLTTTSLGATWSAVSGGSLAGLKSFIDSRFFGPVLDPLLTALLAYPGFVVLGVPGVLLILAGRARRTRKFVRQDQL